MASLTDDAPFWVLKRRNPADPFRAARKATTFDEAEKMSVEIQALGFETSIVHDDAVTQTTHDRFEEQVRAPIAET